ncbi:biotin/lipoyl-binding protein [Hominisplanchenecus murintestinalis]|uniref:biotin/lipoyl-binding protein n=1 Tax=Hominisplanchenecus murintestinalis TaxID=2941517 RepID=UPI00203FC129|nr:biotin/lipoyl-binding protein [Hominisplanchenecus murintestinalis]
MKKKIIQMLGGFLALMILFTLLSRAADSAGIPRVTTTTIQSLSIVHKVTAQGKVEENREQAVTTEANQRVKAIYVNEGQQVEEGELLFEIDMEELREQILNMEQEIEKQKLQTQDSLSSKAVEAERKALEQQRASSDYADAQSQGDRAVERARQELEEAKKALEEYKKPSSEKQAAELKRKVKEKKEAWDAAKKELQALEKELEDAIAEEKVKAAGSTETGETETKETAVPTAGQIENELKSRYQDVLDTAKEKTDAAEKEMQDAEEALKEYQNGAAQRKEQRESEKGQLEQAVRDKQAAYEDAQASRESSLRSAGNAVAGASVADAQDSTARLGEIEMEQKELALSKLQKLEKAQGKIMAPIRGVITKIALTTGDRTPDGTAILLADLSSGCKFVAQVPKEQEKYIARKDAATLIGGDDKKIEGLEIASVQMNEENQEQLDVTVNLPADTLSMGQAATLEVSRKAGSSRSCVPLETLHYDSQQAYVLVAEESQTVLGTEMTARRVDVTVLDKNEKYAAIQEGDLTPEQKLVQSSDRSVEPGGRIRLEEE